MRSRLHLHILTIAVVISFVAGVYFVAVGRRMRRFTELTGYDSSHTLVDRFGDIPASDKMYRLLVQRAKFQVHQLETTNRILATNATVLFSSGLVLLVVSGLVFVARRKSARLLDELARTEAETPPNN